MSVVAGCLLRPGTPLCVEAVKNGVAITMTNGQGQAYDLCTGQLYNSQALESGSGGFCDASEGDTTCSECLKSACCSELTACGEDTNCLCRATNGKAEGCTASAPSDSAKHARAPRWSRGRGIRWSAGDRRRRSARRRFPFPFPTTARIVGNGSGQWGALSAGRACLQGLTPTPVTGPAGPRQRRYERRKMPPRAGARSLGPWCAYGRRSWGGGLGRSRGRGGILVLVEGPRPSPHDVVVSGG